MNPLTVLTGGMIMQQRASMAGDDSSVWLDSAGRYRLSLNSSDEALGLHLDGVAQAFCHIRDEADLGHLEPGLAVAPASLSLQSIIHLRQTTGHPVLLAEGGKILGVCGEAEIIRALAGGRHSSAGSP
jgi:hypothetical protein